MKKLVYILFLMLILSFFADVFAQDRIPIQFSGVVVSRDSLFPVPFANIIVKKTHRGTMSDYYGFFSFVALSGDVIEFSSIGYKKGTFVIPDTLTENKYSLIQVLDVDTIVLKEVIIYPWPTYEQFKQAFVKTEIPDDDITRAQKNLAVIFNREKHEQMPMDGRMNYRNYLDQQTSKLYYAGQLPPNNLLNPFAWAQFIDAWRKGKFKIQNSDFE